VSELAQKLGSSATAIWSRFVTCAMDVAIREAVRTLEGGERTFSTAERINASTPSWVLRAPPPAHGVFQQRPTLLRRFDASRLRRPVGEPRKDDLGAPSDALLESYPNRWD
jgi:hypothetical protein